MKHLIFFFQWILTTVLENLRDYWIVFFYKLVYFQVFYMACINYYISQKYYL